MNDNHFAVHIEIVILIMLLWKFNVFYVIPNTQKCRSRHQNQISMLNIVKVIRILQIA